MGYANLEREGRWFYYECTSCFYTAWYHESDPKACKNCGRRTLIVPPPPKDEAEKVKRDRQLGLY